MHQFLNKFIFISIPVLILLFTVNYFGDAARIFDSEYEKEMAKILMNGSFATNISNYDERLFQKELIINKTKAPEILVLGSSRTMLINSKYFPNQTIFNNSVSGASIEDIIALFQIYIECNILPRRLIIGIDPWLLNQNNGQLRWKSLEDFYNKYKKRDVTLAKNSLYQYSELYSLSYFQASIKALPKLFSETPRPIATKERYNLTNTILTDGSLVYSSRIRNQTQEQINLKIKNYIVGDVYSLENFDDISFEIWSEFQNFILYLISLNITVEFFLAPYPPMVYDYITKNYQNVINTEDLIIDFSNINGIKLNGSFNPYKFRLDETYFFDGMHCNRKCIDIILQSEMNE